MQLMNQLGSDKGRITRTAKSSRLNGIAEGRWSRLFIKLGGKKFHNPPFFIKRPKRYIFWDFVWERMRFVAWLCRV